MTTIIAGGFDNIVPAQAALERLQAAGVSTDDICTFRVNPPGMHDRTPIGGDRHESAGAKHADSSASKGAAAGAAAGLAVGAIATPFLGPAGMAAGVAAGAYTGSLVGAMKGTDNEMQPGHQDLRPAEVMVAVNASAGPLAADGIVRLFEECGAWQVESAEGEWSDGVWADFDPISYPHLIGGRDKHMPRPTAS
jgi:hypothetical protein